MGFSFWFGSRSKPLTGVDIGSSAVKVASLRRNGQNTFHLEALALEPLPPDAIVDGTILSKLPVADTISRIFNENRIRNRRIATSISGNSVIVKKVVLPARDESELAESIQWEAEQYIPFDVSDVNLDFHVVRRLTEENKIEVILVAAKRDKITDHTGVVSMAGMVPEVVDIDAFALQNVYEVNYEPEPDKIVALLNIGANMINIDLVKGTDFLFNRDINMGGSHFTDFLQKELDLSYEDAERFKRGGAPDEELQSRTQAILDSVSENLCLEVQKTFDYFKTSTQFDEIHEIYVSGGGSHTEGLLGYLQRRFEVPVQYLDPFKRIECDPQAFPPDYLDQSAADFAVAVGLALRSSKER